MLPLVCGLPPLSYIHSGMASEYDGASAILELEPPGFTGLNYGQRTPCTTLAGQAISDALLGGLETLRGPQGLEEEARAGVAFIVVSIRKLGFPPGPPC